METVIGIFQRYPLLLLKGTVITILIALASVFFGSTLGVLLALFRRSRLIVLRAAARTYVEIIRGTPLLLQLWIFAFALQAMGLNLPKVAGVIFALGMNSAAYVSEIIRAGIQAVDVGQTEAARSLGLSSSMTMKHIVLPQAIKNILPALGNEFVMMIKETSLASTFFIGDLMTVQSSIRNTIYKALEPLICVAVIYFVLTFSLGKLMSMLERRMAAGD